MRGRADDIFELIWFGLFVGLMLGLAGLVIYFLLLSVPTVWHAVSAALTWPIPDRLPLVVVCLLAAGGIAALKIYLWSLGRTIKERKVHLDDMTKRALGIEAWTDEALGQAGTVYRGIVAPARRCECMACQTLQRARTTCFADPPLEITSYPLDVPPLPGQTLEKGWRPREKKGPQPNTQREPGPPRRSPTFYSNLEMLRERRQHAWNEAMRVAKRKSNESRSFSAEENRRWDALMVEIDQLDKDIEAAVFRSIVFRSMHPTLADPPTTNP